MGNRVPLVGELVMINSRKRLYVLYFREARVCLVVEKFTKGEAYDVLGELIGLTFEINSWGSLRLYIDYGPKDDVTSIMINLGCEFIKATNDLVFYGSTGSREFSELLRLYANKMLIHYLIWNMKVKDFLFLDGILQSLETPMIILKREVEDRRV